MSFKKKHLFVIFTYVLAYLFFRRVKNPSLNYICTLYYKDRFISYQGFLDTGNLVKNTKGKDVIIIDKDIIKNLLNLSLSFKIMNYNDYLNTYNNLPFDLKQRLSYTFLNYQREKIILPILNLDKIIIEKKDFKKTIYNPCVGVLDINESLALLPLSILK